MVGGTGQSGTGTASGHEGERAELILGDLGVTSEEVTSLAGAIAGGLVGLVSNTLGLALSVYDELTVTTLPDRRVEISVVGEGADAVRAALKEKALELHGKDIEVCRKIGEYGADPLKNCDSVLTHCNAGRLATVKYGTALAPVYVAAENGHKIRVFSDETRPLLQGARLTSFELANAGIDTTLICDNAASYVMKNGLVSAVLVGCDRVAANGDTANKIGTSGVAVLAKYYGIPFYVCAPFSTIDKNCLSGRDIKIEMRSGDEITDMWYEKRMAPKNIRTLNPAFDVTDNSLITAFITEKGVLSPNEF